MCFSYQADLVAAAALAPLGVLTLRSARSWRERPIAATPLFFAAHQLIESFVWLGTDGRISPAWQNVATLAYLAMAQVVLPIYVPIAIALLEPERARRRLILAAACVGFAVAARFSWILIDEGAVAYPAAHAMVYETPTDMGVLGGLGYLTATCLTMLVCSQRWVRVLGVVNLLGIGIAALIRYEAVTSVWCAYSALVSGLILLHLRQTPAPRLEPVPRLEHEHRGAARRSRTSRRPRPF